MIETRYYLNKNVIRNDIKSGKYPSQFIRDMMAKDGVILCRSFNTFEELVLATINEILIPDNISNISVQFDYDNAKFDCCVVDDGRVQISLLKNNKTHRIITTKDCNLNDILKDAKPL